ncbi:Hypothetical predicted protein [Podarcis lilfordi]|uniref:Uncharacterized protein n=1 Tax=Podarcis lilfordi TaxID=74358 RepID=A0AA35LFR4_9SAUR|nr:Hypothetical predicted protein [Podarcis lilfordi]
MERKEQRGGGRRTDAHQDPCEGEPGGAVVQRTQVVLLAGEPWGAESGQQVLSSFAHHVLPTTGGGPQEAPGAEPTAKSQQQQQQQQQLGTQSPPCTSSVAPSGQLTFFLCRAASLRERAARLREVLQGVRDQSRGAPAALVGVIVQPRPEEDRGRLLYGDPHGRLRSRPARRGPRAPARQGPRRHQANAERNLDRQIKVYSVVGSCAVFRNNGLRGLLLLPSPANVKPSTLPGLLPPYLVKVSCSSGFSAVTQNKNVQNRKV